MNHATSLQHRGLGDADPVDNQGGAMVVNDMLEAIGAAQRST